MNFFEHDSFAMVDHLHIIWIFLVDSEILTIKWLGIYRVLNYFHSHVILHSRLQVIFPTNSSTRTAMDRIFMVGRRKTTGTFK